MMKTGRTRWIATLALAFVACAAFGQARLISRLAAGVDPNAVAVKYQLTLIDATPNAPFALFGAASDSAGSSARLLMLKDSQILWTEGDGDLSSPESVGSKGSSIPAIGSRSSLYAQNTNLLAQINWSSKLANSPGRSVIVAVLDTGLDASQLYLWNKVCATANFVEPGTAPFDMPQLQDSNQNGIFDEAVGHGTMVAGLVDQMSPQSQLAIARVADSDGHATAWRVLCGVAFAANSGAEVVNISLGSQTQIVAFRGVLDWCDEMNMVVVAPIGNDNHFGASYPSQVAKAICVSGLNPNNTKASFSNWDRTADISAPATGIYSLDVNGGEGLWSGTSFASPIVAGAIADCLRRTGPIQPRQWFSLLKDSGQDVNSLNPLYKDMLGHLINVAKLDSVVQAKFKP